MRARCLLVGMVVVNFVAWFSPGTLAEPELLGHWPLDKNLHDVVGDNHGQFVEFKAGRRFKTRKVLESVPGEWGNGLRFVGPSTCVEIPRAPELEPADSLTVIAWVNFAQLSERQEIVSYADSYVVVLESGFQAFIFNKGNWSFANSGITPLTDKWYFVAMTYDGADVKVYVNGKLSGIRAVPGVIQYQDAPLTFGCNFVDAKWLFENNREWWLIGVLDEISIWDAPMTEREIEAVYESPPSPRDVTPTGKLTLTWGELRGERYN